MERIDIRCSGCNELQASFPHPINNEIKVLCTMCATKLQSENADLHKIIERYKQNNSEWKQIADKRDAEIARLKEERDNIQEDFNGRLKPSYDYVDGIAVSVAEDEIDRLQVENTFLRERLARLVEASKDLINQVENYEKPILDCLKQAIDAAKEKEVIST